MKEPNTQPEPIALSNSIRLRGREWLTVGIFALGIIVFAPSLWKQIEPFPPVDDYRMPHNLGNDYWLYERWAGIAAERYDTLLIGDSVVWGEYTTPQETLSHYLNEIGGRERCANLGLDGTHPLALSGLVDHYTGNVKGKNVVLQCNLLWLSSPRRDLQEEKETEFNHPRLVPQFRPRIPAYKQEVSLKLGVLVEQQVPLWSWTNHLQQAYYGGSGIPGWTLEHPRDALLEPLEHGLPSPDEERRHPPRPWYESGITEQDFPWVDLETSLQWQGFQTTVESLQKRGNRVFVLVGPFNEHLLKPASLKQYQALKSGIAAWLEAQHIPFLAPSALPSQDYGDASHPLASGYAALARQLLEHPFFR